MSIAVATWIVTFNARYAGVSHQSYILLPFPKKERATQWADLESEIPSPRSAVISTRTVTLNGRYAGALTAVGSGQ